MEEANLKPVKIHWEEIEKYSVFKIMRFEVKCGQKVLGYYRIWHDPVALIVFGKHSANYRY